VLGGGLKTTSLYGKGIFEYMKVFISYSWDSNSHQNWILNLANKLRDNGIDANIDVFYFQEETTNINKMMIKNIKESDYIIVVLTENYRQKVDNWKDGVGYENELLLPIFRAETERNKLIFIMRHNGNYKDVFPFHIQDYYAIDFTDNSNFSLKFKELLHRIYGEPLYPKKNIGEKPKLIPISVDNDQYELSNSDSEKLIKSLNLNSSTENIIVVANVNDLIKSIGSNRTIYLKQGIYNLSKASRLLNTKIEWKKEYDGKYPIIKGIENLSITAEVGTQIVIEPRYVFVFAFVNCNNISFHNITLGHTNSGYCVGGVLSFRNSSAIVVKNSILYGSGTIGLVLVNTVNFQFIESTIKECTYSIMHINDSDNIVFSKAIFKDTAQFDLIEINNSINVTFDKCTFMNNRTDKFMPYLFKIDEDSKKILLQNSIVKYNEIEEFINHKERIQIINCEINRNYFTV